MVAEGVLLILFFRSLGGLGRLALALLTRLSALGVLTLALLARSLGLKVPQGTCQLLLDLR